MRSIYRQPMAGDPLGSVPQGQEVNLTLTDPTKEDTDGTGALDGAEDLDSDGLDNLAEVNIHGTDPRDEDSDDDGVNDGAETSYVGSTYAPVEGGFTRPQAQADALARMGRVAVFPNGADFGLLMAAARGQTTASLWIGLSDAATEGVWLWDDGSPLNYDRWFEGQPDGGVAENHVVIAENETTWADAVEDFVAGGYLFEFVGLNPNEPDSDGDGLTDGEEIDTVGSNPVIADTDQDGLSDGDEVNTHGSSPLLSDTDSDGLGDYVEVTVHGSDPSSADTDGDGFDDKFEVDTGFDPASAVSTPDTLSSIRTAVEFRFNGANGASYRVESSIDLENWIIVEDDIAGNGGVIVRFYSTENKPVRSFRARRN